MDPLFDCFWIDAFSTSAFGGSPAAVCVFKRALPDATLQRIAREFNLSETVFIARRASGYDIRWFTPTVEVDLVGHATLAAAYAITTHLKPDRTDIEFYSHRSGLLRAYGDRTSVSIELPADTPQSCDAPAALSSGLGRIPVYVLKGGHYVLPMSRASNRISRS